MNSDTNSEIVIVNQKSVVEDEVMQIVIRFQIRIPVATDYLKSTNCESQANKFGILSTEEFPVEGLIYASKIPHPSWSGVPNQASIPVRE